MVLIYADNDPNGEYFGFGFTAGFNVTYDEYSIKNGEIYILIQIPMEYMRVFMYTMQCIG